MKRKSIVSKKKVAACAALVASLFVLASALGLLPSEADLKNTQVQRSDDFVRRLPLNM